MTKRLLTAAAVLLVVLSAAHAGIDLQNFDRAVKPQDDFFRYVNGTWLKTMTIPPGESRWGSFTELRERNWQNVHAICEQAAAKTSGASAIERIVGDFYASGMDEAAINAAGIAPLKPELALIAACRTPADILLAQAHLRLLGVTAGFSLTAEPDAKDSDRELARLGQSGLSLPADGRLSDRDYYLNDDDKSKAIRAQFTAHVAKMLELLGDSPDRAQAGAAAVLRIETALAKAELSRVQLRDAELSYHKMPVAELAKNDGGLDLAGYFAAMGAPAFTEINLAHPDFMKAFAAQLASAPVADWQAYLRWHLALTAAPYLSAPFEEENFRFYQTVLSGVKEQKPRWREVAAAVDGSRSDGIAGVEGGVGEALGQLYVAKYFPPEAKASVLQLVANVRAALRERLLHLEWMDAPTRAKAVAKLDAFTVKMGYPDKWKDYSAAHITRDSFVLNVLHARGLEVKRDLAKIGGPVDKSEWSMTPPTVNAYYSVQVNGIAFPAGILQPPFFDPQADAAVNYGGIGTVIGHEMTHGFDDHGRHYDQHGNLVDWWTPESAAKFNERAAGIVRQFSSYTVLDGVHLKGELTQGENIADLGGLKVSFAALEKALAGQPRAKIDGFTPEQRFFISYANVWRDAFTPAEQRRRVNIDPHSPGEWRTNGPLSNLPEFWAAFDVPEGAPMRRPAGERVTIW